MSAAGRAARFPLSGQTVSEIDSIPRGSAVSRWIAADATADEASRLVQAGALVGVILTAGAHEFIQPLTSQGLTKRPAPTDGVTPWIGSFFGHVSQARETKRPIVTMLSWATGYA